MPKGLEDWLEKLTKRSMPVVGKVINELNKLSGSEDTDMQRVTEVILRDPNMTSHVLRIANSVQYNYTGTSVNTVSRAVVLIGLKGMRAMCVSLLMIDTMLKKAPKERVLDLMARGFHAATQAKNLVRQYDEEACEEVFVASLLFNVGEMAFLASEKITDDNEDLFSEDPKVRRKAMEEYLGTSFRSLSLGLAKEWQLSETLEQALDPESKPNERSKAVLLGERLSRAALHGWDSPAVEKVLGEVAHYSDLEIDECMDVVKDSAEQAAEVALQYGASDCCPLIPDRLRSIEDLKNEHVKKKNEGKILKGDPQLQLKIIRELSACHDDPSANVNTVMQMLLEGLHRGVGLERVAVAMIMHHEVVAKFCLGEDTETWRQTFSFDVGPFSDNLFVELVQSSEPTWLKAEYIDENKKLFDKDMTRVLGPVPAFVYILEVKGRKVAMIYADRADYGGQLDHDQFESFTHFCKKAEINLSQMSQKKARR